MSKLDDALADIESQFGKGSVMRYGDTGIPDIEVVSTGSRGVDKALGIGGLPYGRIVEVYGPESSGKTTLTLEVLANAQKDGRVCAFIDAEHALDPQYAADLGVDLDNLVVSQPDTGEQAMQIVEKLIGACNVIVVDSVAALTPQAELNGEVGDHHMGLLARLMSQCMRMLTGKVKNTDTLLIFINQIRQSMAGGYGSSETRPGGNALKFHSSVRIDIRRIGAVKNGDEIIGNETRVKIVKNKMAPPFKQTELQVLYGKGFNREGEVLDAAIKQKIVKKKGAWFSYNEENIGQGKTNTCQALKDNPDLCKEIEEQLE